MAEVHLEIPDQYVREVRESLRKIHRLNGLEGEPSLTPRKIFGEALSVYRWVVEQTEAGHAVVSTADFVEPIAQIKTDSIPAINPSGWAPKGGGETAVPSPAGLG